jgi:hypothetical protein
MTNTEDNKECVNCEKKPILAMIVIGGSALVSLLILVLFIRWLYHNGSPKKCD